MGFRLLNFTFTSFLNCFSLCFIIYKNKKKTCCLTAKLFVCHFHHIFRYSLQKDLHKCFDVVKQKQRNDSLKLRVSLQRCFWASTSPSCLFSDSLFCPGSPFFIYLFLKTCFNVHGSCLQEEEMEKFRVSSAVEQSQWFEHLNTLHTGCLHI